MYSSDSRPPLPEWILDVYEMLLEYIDKRDGQSAKGYDQERITSITREQAADVLLAIGDVSLAPADVNHAIERLLDRGYFYEVDNELHVTQPECRTQR